MFHVPTETSPKYDYFVAQRYTCLSVIVSNKTIGYAINPMHRTPLREAETSLHHRDNKHLSW
jgi:hypothetical protein